MKTIKYIKYFILVSFLVIQSAYSASENLTPTLSAFSIKAGNFVSPDNNSHYTLFTYSSLRPYTLFRDKPAHEMLKLKGELGIGFADGEESGTIVSANVLVHRYLTAPSKSIRLFAEAGIGFIYTEFKIPGQGLYFNFNPKAGIGFEGYGAKNIRYFISFGFSHISNGGLNKDNKGINAFVLSFGRDLSQ